MDKTTADLAAAGVPVSDVNCRACPDPCDEGHEEWPSRFDVDFESQMLSSVKPYRRQVVISSGKADWAREVTDIDGTLAFHLSSVAGSAPKSKPAPSASPDAPHVEGVFASSSSGGRLSILNGSHHTVADDHADETVLVFPDYKLVSGVPASEDGARKLWSEVLDPSVGSAGKKDSASGLKSWVLPYAFVILLCSHKKRDNRCHIAAPKLEDAFNHSLSRHGYEVHTQPEDPHHHSQKPLEEFVGSVEEREKEVLRRLREAADGELDHDGHGKKVLILKNSHIGGHRYAGNAIIYTPNGVGVWYGRVSTHEVETIVTQTIIGGQVLPPLLRGGINLQKPGCKSLHDW